MNTDRLKTFVIVVDRKSFSAAARELGVSQPAVSLCVKSLEDELGERLLDRQGEELHLTSAGEILYGKARVILDLIREIGQELSVLRERPEGRLALGASTIPSEYLLPRILRGFRNAYPGVRISLEVAGTSGIVEGVLERSLDFGVIGAPPDESRFDAFVLGTDEMWLIAPPGTAKMPALCSQSLAGQDFVFRKSGSGTRWAMDRFLAQCGLDSGQVRSAGEFGSTEAVIAAVEAGLGVSFVSSLAAARASEAGRVVILPTACPPLIRTFYGISLKSRRENRLLRLWHDFLTGGGTDSFNGRNI